MDSLQSIRDERQTLQSRQPVLITNLSERKNNLQQILRSPACSNCQPLSLSTDKLQIEADYSKIPSVDSELNKMKDIAAYNLQGQIEKGLETFKNIPQMTVNKTSSTVESSKVALDGIQPVLASLLSPSLSSASAFITNIQLGLREQGPEVQRYDYIRWNVSIVLCSMILLIVLLNFLGLAFGIRGVCSRQDPGVPNCPSSSGANLLMASVGFSFLFSWLLILLVFVLFFVGGNVETFFCRNWKNQELFKFIDTPGNLPNNLDITNAFGIKFNISTVYNGCRAGRSLYTILNLDQQFNLQNFLDINKLSAEFTAKLGLLSVDRSGVQLLSDEGRVQVQEFRDSGVESFNSTELNKNPVQIDLLMFAAQLEKKALEQVDPLVKNYLTDEAQKLRVLQRDIVDLQMSDVGSLNASLNALSFTSKALQGHADKTLTSLDTVENKLNTDVPAIARTLSSCFLLEWLTSLQQYLDWAMKAVAEALSCQSVAVSLDNIYTISCENVVNPWNAFWLSLGWCTLFLIPSIIFAVKTAKHFRAVRSSSKSQSPPPSPPSFPPTDLLALDTMFVQVSRAKPHQQRRSSLVWKEQHHHV
ncbi:prominin-2-like [Polyodon spathula]|uniref:prominin-2-like n=1 Tax=Polyodon spathula TaxID=7913 RepID=UPI001B7DAE17|nr:prominin-2-like [Polyodon spathula]